MPFSTSSFFSDSSSCSSSTSVVSRHEFNAFHKIDRTLFTRLVFALNREIDQSYHVIAFLLLLEQNSYARNVIAYLVSLPDTFIDAVANEIGLCLSFLYNQNLFVGNVMDDDSFIPLILRITGGRFTLGSIDQNRETFLQVVAINLENICSRAFEDLSMRAEMYHKERLLEKETIIEEMRNMRLSAPQGITTTRLRVPQETSTLPPLLLLPATKEITNKVSARTEVTNNPSARTEITNKPHAITETTEEEEEEKMVAADDRTVFLTFSKGYPISEEEVRVHFTKLFGDVIEAITMQEVEENDQPLCARMVLKVHSVSKMVDIVSGRNRYKFTINGKHVWARKYVPKNLSCASSSSHH